MKISAIIATYNRDKTIRRSIESILNQTVPVHEIIVVDDCGNDDTEDVVASIGSDIVSYVRLNHNVGAGAARNYGVSISTGDWIAFNDSDDEWTFDKIEKCSEYLSKNPDIQILYSSYTNMNSGGIVPLVFNMDHYDGNMLETLLVRNTVGAPTMFIKKNAYNDIGGFEESLRCLEDWDLAIRFAKKYEFGFIPDSLLNVYRVDKSISFDDTQYFKTMCYMISKYKDDLLLYGKFNTWILKVMQEAEVRGVKSQVERMLTLYLQMQK